MVVKAMTIVQSILTFAVSEEIVEYNAAAAVAKPRYQRAREPHIFLPVDVEEIRARLEPRGAMLVSLLAYSGPRPEEVVRRLAWRDVGERAIRYVDTKRHRVPYTPLLAPLAEDRRDWFLLGATCRRPPVLPAHDAGFWQMTTGATGASAAGTVSSLNASGWIAGMLRQPEPGALRRGRVHAISAQVS